MPALSQNVSTLGKFYGQVMMPGTTSRETLDLLLQTGNCNGLGVAIWPTINGAIIFSGQVQGKQVHGLGAIEFPNARSSWAVAFGKFESGMFSFGTSTASDLLDFLSENWQKFAKLKLQTTESKAEFKGQWKDGHPFQGITIFPNGSRHIGGWKDGKWHDSGMFVDSMGNWCKGLWCKGELVMVTNRSLLPCSVPSENAPLLANAEVANMSSQSMQEEFKHFQELADKLAAEGLEVCKFAKSISNLAYLKSESRVDSTQSGLLGLPKTNTSSLSGALELADLIPFRNNPSIQYKYTPSVPVAKSEPSAQFHTAPKILDASMTLAQRRDPNVATTQSLLSTSTAQTREVPSMQKTSILQSDLPVTPSSTLRSLFENKEQTVGSGKAAADPAEVGKKMALLFINPPTVQVGDGERDVLIEGCCPTEKELHDISVLCISGNKFVKCKTVLKKLSTEKNIHSHNVGVPTFQLKLSYTPTAPGVTYFLLASNQLQQPFPMHKTLGPCRAMLTMNNSSNEFHVAPLLVMESDKVCDEIRGLFELKKGEKSGSHQSKYIEHAGFLQHFGTFLSTVKEYRESLAQSANNLSAPDPDLLQKKGTVRQFLVILLIVASRLWLVSTLEYLCGLIETLHLKSSDMGHSVKMSDHLYDLVDSFLNASVYDRRKLAVIVLLVNTLEIPIHVLVKKPGSYMSVMHRVSLATNSKELLLSLLQAPNQPVSQWAELKDSKGQTPLNYAKLRHSMEVVEAIVSCVDGVPGGSKAEQDSSTATAEIQTPSDVGKQHLDEVKSQEARSATLGQMDDGNGAVGEVCDAGNNGDAKRRRVGSSSGVASLMKGDDRTPVGKV
eukprot:CAMPEP_0198239930 /NCGR_PEP_ID=MMETSP1446-20131203/5196_1 /TAXON_ID=1461542 ORGANISM="Unidentified sp, Strain CCMP2111" /NCGR_SAMPLE_ID=MMETSP1446 /ASSEMBLY_ACC=CAM_ASM_001112 /LENGTH=838 /DNA_ID=CAMNT_0043922601 /DNA_START=358 /DNA_END=2877 /DNA_ORIENTATION=-